MGSVQEKEQWEVGSVGIVQGFGEVQGKGGRRCTRTRVGGGAPKEARVYVNGLTCILCAVAYLGGEAFPVELALWPGTGAGRCGGRVHAVLQAYRPALCSAWPIEDSLSLHVLPQGPRRLCWWGATLGWLGHASTLTVLKTTA